ncbi:MFS transporter, partial [Chromobacterium piscinae]
MRAIGDTLAASPLEMQQALTVYLFCYALMMLWHGSISDAVGRRPVVLATSLLFGLASVGCALSETLGTLLLFRALQGLCGGAGLVVGRAIIRDRLDGAAAQRLMSQVTMLFSLSPAIAPVVGGWLFGAFGWHSI